MRGEAITTVLWSALLFILAGFAEIGGGYLVRPWLREDQAFFLGALGRSS